MRAVKAPARPGLKPQSRRVQPFQGWKHLALEARNSSSPGVQPRALAAALAGDSSALAALAADPANPADPANTELAQRHRIAPALALRAKRLGIGGPVADAWHRSLLATTAHLLRMEECLARVATALGGAGVPWVLIKGCDLAHRVYERPEERPFGDIDLLVADEDWPHARAILVDAGWQPLFEGKRSERYFREEGYAWALVDRDGLPLEIHRRLWGLVPDGLAPALLAAAEPEPSRLGATGRHLPLAHAWLLAAVHAWLHPQPRPLLSWWELERIGAADPAIAREAAQLAERWDLQLPAYLAAARAAELWGSEPNRAIAEHLLDGLRLPERLALGREPGLPAIVLARLLAGRASRAGWRSLPRQFWAHPGVVEQETRPDRSWPARRALHVLRALRALRVLRARRLPR